MKKILIGIMSIIILSGCSANMAANGQNGPDLSLIKKEYTRREVELFLGAPISATASPNGHMIARYDVEARTEPDIMRAAGHSTLDLFTFGLWELVGGPIEMHKGRRQLVTVDYDAASLVVSVSSTDKPLF
ncbi:MAG: hypothetical protein V7752_20165 [Halopseudomonas sp.]